MFANDINDEMIEDFEFIDASITNVDIQSQVAPRLLRLSIIELCLYIFREKASRKMVFDMDGDLSVGTKAVLASLRCVVKLTDFSTRACHRVIETGFHKHIFNFLKHHSKDLSKVKLADSAMNGRRKSAVVWAMYDVAYNAINVSFFLFNIFFL